MNEMKSNETKNNEEMIELRKMAERGRKAYNTTQRQTAKTRILVRKAKEAGFVVTDAEIDEFIKKNSK